MQTVCNFCGSARVKWGRWQADGWRELWCLACHRVLGRMHDPLKEEGRPAS